MAIALFPNKRKPRGALVFLDDESDCRFVKDVYQHCLHITVVNDRRPPPIVHRRKARLIRRSSREGEHREVLVLSIPTTKQILVVVEGKERVIRLKKKRITRDFYSDNTEPFPMPA